MDKTNVIKFDPVEWRPFGAYSPKKNFEPYQDLPVVLVYPYGRIVLMPAAAAILKDHVMPLVSDRFVGLQNVPAGTFRAYKVSTSRENASPTISMTVFCKKMGLTIPGKVAVWPFVVIGNVLAIEVKRGTVDTYEYTPRKVKRGWKKS